jgi:hypothetical protein
MGRLGVSVFLRNRTFQPETTKHVLLVDSINLILDLTDQTKNSTLEGL